MATELRRYQVRDAAGLDGLIEWFPNIVKVREHYGFTVHWAYADHETLQFFWLVSHPEFAEAFEVYNVSPERLAAFEGFDNPVTEMHLTMVTDVATA